MAKILVTCRTCRHAVVRTEGNSYTADGHEPFLCDCMADMQSKPASIDRYGNRLTMILGKPHPCPAYKAAEGCPDEMAAGKEMIALAKGVSELRVKS